MFSFSCKEDPVDTSTEALLQELGLSLDDQAAAEEVPRELVYRQITTRGPAGEKVVEEEGALNYDQFQRVARPYAHAGEGEDWLYEEQASSRAAEDGSIVDIYEVYRSPNMEPVTPQLTPDGEHEVRFSSLVAPLAEEADESIDLIAHLRDFPVFYEPLTPPPHMLSLETAQRLSDDRKDVRQERAGLADAMSQSFQEHVESAGGVFYSVIDWGGAVFFSYPVEKLDDLKDRDDIEFVETADDPTVKSQQSSCSAGDQSCYDTWFDNYLGRIRIDERVGVESYWDDGHTGGQSNSGRHSFGQMVAAVVEAGYFEDREPCYLADDDDCDNDRTIAQYDCHIINPCSPFSCHYAQCILQAAWGPDQLDEETYHGTAVSSVILGNYLDGQGNQEELDDPHYEDHGWHTSQWESDATGMAPGAGLIFLQGREIGYRTLSYSAAYNKARELNADVLNMSHSYQTGEGQDGGKAVCDPVHSGLRQNALAAAFDDGVFLVGTTGNVGELNDCLIAQPGSVPRVFTVGGMNMGTFSCQTNYTNCGVHVGSSLRGGADVDINGVLREGAYSLTDVTAPTRLRRVTTTDNTKTDDPLGPPTGYVHEGITGGSSIAAPVVSGSALVVKDYLIDDGRSWVNSPGRLHAVMLSMADRWHYDTQDRESSGADSVSGMGRFKLRPMKAGLTEVMNRWSIRTRTFSSSGGLVARSPWSSPLLSSAEMVKCTMNVPQDHRNSTDLANLDFALLLRQPVDGQCVEGYGGLIAAQTDVGYDTKRMAAITADDVNGGLGGACVEYWITPNHIPAGESQMTNTFCYVGTIDDHEPN